MINTGGGALGGLKLDATVQVALGAFRLDVALRVAAGETVAMLGPNGAGKSTLLSVLAGIRRPDHGVVRVGDREVTVVEPGRTVLIPPERRRVGLMSQDPLLFPYLSALENVAFGVRAQGRPRAQARLLAGQWLERMGLSGLADRRPPRLSGGQRQRVALARALAAGPDLLLLDEPLGALDAQTAPEIRQVLRRHLRESGVTAVLVTHDGVDAAVLADRIVVLEQGRVTDDGPAARVLAAPRSPFVAALAGLNVVVGTATAGVAAETVGVVMAGGLSLTGVAAEPLSAGGAAAAVFPPASVALARQAAPGSARNQWSARIALLHTEAARVRVETDGPLAVTADITPAAVAALGLIEGEEVVLSVKASQVRLYRRE